eukprot:9217471-Ditylum_brightwellii.AAC.1
MQVGVDISAVIVAASQEGLDTIRAEVFVAVTGDSGKGSMIVEGEDQLQWRAWWKRRTWLWAW